MASSTTQLKFDQSAWNKWQRLSDLVAAAAANTIATSTQLMQHWMDTTDWAQPFQVFPTSIISGLRIQFLGAGADTNALTAQLYGWNDDGPGNHIGTVTAALTTAVSTKRSGTTPVGFHTSPYTHFSIYKHLDLDTDYRGCDTYAVTDYEGALAASATHADFPGYFELSMANSQYSWVGLMFTSIASTNVMAICRALGRKSRHLSPDGV